MKFSLAPRAGMTVIYLHWCKLLFCKLYIHTDTHLPIQWKQSAAFSAFSQQEVKLASSINFPLPHRCAFSFEIHFKASSPYPRLTFSRWASVKKNVLIIDLAQRLRAINFNCAETRPSCTYEKRLGGVRKSSRASAKKIRAMRKKTCRRSAND